MAELKICRICLRTGVKIYKYDQFQLKLCYEEITALKINKNDDLPLYFCYECAMLLYKFHKFKEKCYQGQRALKALLLNGPLTYQAIHEFDGKSLNLQSMLDIITVNDRVKTFLINDKQNDVIDRKYFKDECDDNNKPEVVNNDEILGNSNDENKKDNLNDKSNSNLSHTVNRLLNKAIESVTDEFSCSDDNAAASDNDPIRESDSPSLTKIFIPEKEIKPEDICVEITDVEHEKSKALKRKCIETGQIKKNKNVPVKNGVRKRKNRKIEKIRKDNAAINHKFARLQSKTLDPSKWRKISLTEKEAVKEFEKRAEDLKYVQASYHCKDCYKFFSKEDIMTRHLKLRHDPSIGPFECRFCHTRFTLKCYLRKHIRKHYTKYECLVCKLVVAIEPTALMHEETHSDVTRTCNLCGEQFKHLSTFYTHLRTHRSKHVCELCGASFVSEAGLHQHKRVRHIGDTEKPQLQQDGDTFCERCQIKFETGQAYAEHLNSSALHADLDSTENAPAPKRRYKRLKIGRTNKRKPTTCHQCGKHFDTQTLCMSHHYKQHPGTSFCPPNERHICEICGVSLAPGSVAMHHNMHSRARLHGCELCARQFHSSAGLKRHLVTHTGEKPFECPLCEKRFTQSNSMKLHYRTFHLKQPYPKRSRNRKKEEIQEAVPMAASEEESY